LNIDGSSTVYPISEGVAEEFSREFRDVQITVGFSGTGGGFEKFCNGEIQIADASRPIKQEEIDACAENGIEMTEFRVAIDGLSVVVNPENDWVTCLTVDQLTQMFGPESTVETWADVDPSWPNERITFYIPGTDSGTFEYFTETIGGEPGATRTKNIQTSEDDNVLVTGVQGDRNAIGYFGYAYYIENRNRVKIVPIDNGNGCVEPTDETVNSGEYAPLSRPLLIYVNNDALDEPQVAEFIRFYMTDGRAIIPEVGYVELPDEIYEENLRALDAAMDGEIVPMWSRGLSVQTGAAVEATTSDGPSNTEEISGTLDIDGSSTVYPISEAVAEEFTREHPDVRVTVGFSGTGGGFEKFCNGEIQIADASRPVKQEEIDACAENGIEMTEFMVAIDGLSVVVNASNDWVNC